jgi:hypothetical protein
MKYLYAFCLLFAIKAYANFDVVVTYPDGKKVRVDQNMNDVKIGEYFLCNTLYKVEENVELEAISCSLGPVVFSTAKSCVVGQVNNTETILTFGYQGKKADAESKPTLYQAAITCVR